MGKRGRELKYRVSSESIASRYHRDPPHAMLGTPLVVLVLWLGERIASLMEGRGHRLSEYQGNDGWFVPLPATFVVGTDGRVIASHVDPEFRSRMDVEEILAALQSAER